MVSEGLAPVPMACVCAGEMWIFDTNQCNRYSNRSFSTLGTSEGVQHRLLYSANGLGNLPRSTIATVQSI